MSDFYNALTDKQKLYFDHYKSNDPYPGPVDFATRLNDMLMKGNLESEFQEACDVLDEIIELNLIDEKIQLYRATSVEFIESFLNNGKFICPAYVSTGRDMESIKGHFKGVPLDAIPALLIMTCPSGSKIAPLENDATSGFEKEMLLGRDQEFIIISDKIHTNPAIIRHIMDPDLAEGFDQIRVIDMVLNNNAVNGTDQN
jgi:ADP-ribosyltransferase exoenzyme